MGIAVKIVGNTQPSGTISITENGEYNVARYAMADVNVTGGGGGGGGSTQYPVINYDGDTYLLDWTWQEIKDALDDGKTPLIYRSTQDVVEIVKSASDDGGYSVTSSFNTLETEWYADSADGYPTDD